MYKSIIENCMKEIADDYELCRRILKKLGPIEEEATEMVQRSALMAMCIKYETFTSDLMSAIKKKQMEYNRPGAYTRFFADKFKIDIKKEYEAAHDAGEFYNAIKHVNHHTRLDIQKIFKHHNIQNADQALGFTYSSLMALLVKLRRIEP